MNKIILIFIQLFFAFNLFAQNSYGLKEVFYYEESSFKEFEKNDSAIAFDNWSCAIIECVRMPCWLTIYHEEYIYTGVGQQKIASHHLWFKELSIYDKAWNLIARNYDSICDIPTLLRIGKKRSFDYLNRRKKYIYHNGDSIYFDSSYYPIPKSKKDALEDEKYIKSFGCD